MEIHWEKEGKKNGRHNLLHSTLLMLIKKQQQQNNTSPLQLKLEHVLLVIEPETVLSRVLVFLFSCHMVELVHG